MKSQDGISSKSYNIAKRPRVSRATISCDRCKTRKTKCNKPKAVLLWSEEEYRLLCELCSYCFPGEELTTSNLRRLVSEQKKAVSSNQMDISTPIIAIVEQIQTRTSSQIEQNAILQQNHTADQIDQQSILLPEIVNLHHNLGCLMVDAHGKYRYIGPESGISFNSAVRSWILRMGPETKKKESDKIPPMLKVLPPSVNSSFTGAALSNGGLSQLPSQDLLSAYAARFFEQVHSLYWIYSSESFYTKLEATYAGDFRQLSASWLCSLHSIVALCMSCDPSHNGLSNSQQAHKSLEMAKHLVPQVCDKADLDGVRALIVLSLAFQSNGFTNSAYLHVALAVRIAFSLGLHVNKHSTHSGVVSQAHAQRLWWTLYLVDQDISLVLGKPSMTTSSINLAWAPPLPLETVVGPGSNTPIGYLEQCIRLTQLTQRIRQVLYDGPVHGGQELSDVNFNDTIAALKEWLAQVPLHLQLSTSVPSSHRRPISLLHLRYWSAIMLITKPFLLHNLLEGSEHIEPAKQALFAKFAKACLSAAESTIEILENMVFHKVVSYLVMDDFFFTLQCLQVILAGCGLFHADGYQVRVKQCLRILLVISVSGYPKQLLPEPLYQLQQCGLAEDVGDGNTVLAEHLHDSQQVEEALRDESRDYAADQVANSWLNELDMSENAMDIGLWGDLLEISAIFPFEQS